MYRNTYVEVNLDNIKHNVKEIVNKYNYKYYIGVVKGNAYGHGYGIIETLLKNGINFLAVSNLDEALEIRKLNKNIKILCLEPIPLEFINICSKENISICITNINYYKELVKLNLNINVHLKINSGMNRLGFNDKKEINKIYKDITKQNNIHLEGIFSHFATSGIYDKNYDNQTEIFKNLTSDIDLSKIDVVHIDKSATMQAHEKLPFVNGVRLGIILYGYNSIPAYKNTLKDKLRSIKWDMFRKRKNISKPIINDAIDLKYAFSLVSSVLEVHDVPCNSYIGYGTNTYTKEKIKIAIIDIGYADGISRKRINSNVEINNKIYPIIADVCMGMIIVKIDDKVKVGDKATIIGGKVNISYVARHLNTTVYEVMTMINSNIERKYIGGKND